MTTYYVYSRKGRQVLTTHDKTRAETLAAALNGTVQTIERHPTAGELLAMAA